MNRSSIRRGNEMHQSAWPFPIYFAKMCVDPKKTDTLLRFDCDCNGQVVTHTLCVCEISSPLGLGAPVIVYTLVSLSADFIKYGARSSGN